MIYTNHIFHINLFQAVVIHQQSNHDKHKHSEKQRKPAINRQCPTFGSIVRKQGIRAVRWRGDAPNCSFQTVESVFEVWCWAWSRVVTYARRVLRAARTRSFHGRFVTFLTRHTVHFRRVWRAGDVTHAHRHIRIQGHVIRGAVRQTRVIHQSTSRDTRHTGHLF